MGRTHLILAGAAIFGGTIGWAALENSNPTDAEIDSEYVLDPTAQTGEPLVVEFRENGSALAAAAFGLSALQPETYDGDIVLEIIHASHLNATEKEELTAVLLAAEEGQGDLVNVLQDVRVALAVE
jgi:hypothetical protein